MPEPSVFEFRFIDEGTPSTPPVPGSAARAGAPVTTPPPSPRAQAGSQPQQRTSSTGPQSSATKQPPPAKFGQAILDAIQKAGRYSTLGNLTKSGAGVFRPLLDLGQLIKDLRDSMRGGSQRPTGGVAAATPLRAAQAVGALPVFTIGRAVFNAQGATLQIIGPHMAATAPAPGAAAARPLPVATPVSPTSPKGTPLSQAVFNAEGAKILILGGQVAFGEDGHPRGPAPGGASPGPNRPRGESPGDSTPPPNRTRGGFAQPGPTPKPRQAPGGFPLPPTPSGGLPALRSPQLPPIPPRTGLPALPPTPSGASPQPDRTRGGFAQPGPTPKPRQAPGGFPLPTNPRGGLPALRSPQLPSVIPPKTGLPTLPPIPRTIATAVATRLAVPAVAGGLAAAGGGVAALGGAAALAAGPIGLLVVGVGATVLAIRRLNQRIDEQSQSLSAYSATLASAQARAQVANLRQDIRSAQSLGPELAALVESQTRRDVAAKQIADKFESFILPIRTSMMKVEATVLESLVSGGGYLKTVAQGTLEVAAGQAELGDIMKRIEEQNKKAENKKNNEFIQAGDFRGLFDSLDELDISDPTGDVNSPKVRRGASVGAIGFGSLPMLP